ncbi:MAG: fumarylacetoacetate hydrolase family protein [Thermoplasmataceae archaeon]|jgi:2-keto-4-pentenoate hydratase/2-oxohepta-3-ene-1,7-dioic acid hydratase in catechol pathway|nr:fumarylacetoacetate hydrolase family protein [Candidatus Thermoplasmatota archaeon]MCL5787833.1 fumarylacetoacetate hydrolase family protein [Candidatus Thermoplasmatota archaeon]
MDFIVNNSKDGKKSILLSENGKYYLYSYINDSSNINGAISELHKRIPDKLDEYSADIVEDIPVNPKKIFLPAINFRSHSEENRVPSPKRPYFFTKFSNALVGNNGSILKPNKVQYLDYEGEIAAIIGSRVKAATIENAAESIFGFTVCNDISARDYQNDYQERLGKNWLLGKASDTFLPIGPKIWILDKDIPDFQINTYVNHEKRQEGNIRDMIFSFPELIAEVSQFITLEPGDIITSGTPSGVAMGGSGRFLENGDIVSVGAEGIGNLTNKIVSAN